MNLVVTADGSHTIYIPEINEHYHSTFGAITESEHVFIQSGLFSIHSVNKDITVFEAGFGTGLNAFLTALHCSDGSRHITYYAVESHPLEAALVLELNYSSLLKSWPDPQELFASIHKAEWGKMEIIHDHFRICKIRGDMTSYIPDFKTDLVYFDAFAPEKQPEMWTMDVFGKIYDSLNPGGLLTTYCVKGTVKQVLRNSGFRIEKLPGPPGKREILRAWKDNTVI